MSFERARALADAVLFEGYVPYPYRSSAPKNRARWQFGAVAPRSWSAAGGSDPSTFETCCLVTCEGPTRLEGKLRFLHLQRRRLERREPAEPGGFVPVPHLEVDGALHVAWDEAEVREVDLVAPLASAADATVIRFACPGAGEVELLTDRRGAGVGRLRRESRRLEGNVQISVEELLAERSLHRVRIRIENESDWQDPGAPRDQAMAGALLGTHLLLSAPGARFLSLVDPPAWAADAAASCLQHGLHPVLVEEGTGQDVVLAAPFILCDHPQVAPERQGDFQADEVEEV
jgi:hypothetical protein